MTSAAAGEVRHVGASFPKGGARSQSLMIDISVHERWMVMDKEPCQTFKALSLKRVDDYHDMIFREEQVLRCKCRMGRVLIFLT